MTWEELEALQEEDRMTPDLVFRDPGAARRRIESLFRRPEKPARIAGREQYYRPYWSR